MTVRRSGIPIVLAVLQLLLMTGCGTTSSPPAENADGFQSPLEEYVGVDLSMGLGDLTAAEAAYAAQEQKANEKIASCMKAEGFDYIAVSMSALLFAGTDTDQLEWGTKDWVAKYGFGVSTQAYPQDVVGPDLVGYEDNLEEIVDPNDDYIAGLSSSELQAYNEALLAPESGCFDLAWSEVDGPKRAAFFDEFDEDLSVMYEEIAAHPEIVAAERRISSCVAESGLSFTNLDTAITELSAQVDGLQAGESGDDLPDSEDVLAMTQDELEALLAPTIDDESAARLAAIQADERQLAMAYLDCGGRLDNFTDETYLEVVAEVEEKFVNNHRVDLDALNAAYDSS